VHTSQGKGELYRPPTFPSFANVSDTSSKSSRIHHQHVHQFKKAKLGMNLRTITAYLDLKEASMPFEYCLKYSAKASSPLGHRFTEPASTIQSSSHRASKNVRL